MNLIGISGRLTAEPELKTTQSGIAVCQFNLAVKRPRAKDTTDFLTVVAWRQSAEFICRYAHKGNLVGVLGMLTTRKYQDRDGNNRTVTEIVADNVELLESKSENQGNNNPSGQKDPLDAFKDKSRRDCYGEAIHGESKGCEPDFENTHYFFLDKLK